MLIKRPQTEISVSDEAVTMADFIRCNFKVITKLDRMLHWLNISNSEFNFYGVS